MFGHVLAGVLDGLGHDGEHQSVPSHELGLEHVVVVDGLAIFGLGQAVLAVTLRVRHDPGTVDRHQVVRIQEAATIQDLVAHQVVHGGAYQLLVLGGVGLAEPIIDRVPVRDGWYLEEHVVLLRTGCVA